MKLSIISFGGIVVKDAEQQHANRVAAEAFEKGVNYFDVSPTAKPIIETSVLCK